MDRETERERKNTKTERETERDYFRQWFYGAKIVKSKKNDRKTILILVKGRHYERGERHKDKERKI